MEKEYDFDIWYKTKDPIFSEISKKSRLPAKWVVYNKDGKYKNSIIKPINKYVENLYPLPKLISINDKYITLRQHNHAEFFLLQKIDEFYNLDRPWMRQYYRTNFNPEIPDNCFPGTYKFYAPWYIDANIEITYTQPEEESPFFIYETKSIHNKIVDDIRYLEPDFIPFNFKKIGSHMVNDKFGKIPLKSPMFDIVFLANDIIVEEVRKFYEKN